MANQIHTLLAAGSEVIFPLVLRLGGDCGIWGTTCLWHGYVDRVLALLQAIEPAQIKDQTALDILIGYLERNRPYPCYAVRKQTSPKEDILLMY